LFLIVELLIASGELLSLLNRRSHIQPNRYQLLTTLGTAVVSVAALMLALAKWLDFTAQGAVTYTDFSQDYIAGYAVRQGVPVYGVGFSQLSLSLFSFPADNYHPPFNALLFFPFSYLPYASAFYIWNLCSLAAYATVILTALKVYGLHTYPWSRLSTLLLLWEPFMASVGLGQISALLALMIIGGFFFLRSGREKTAGVLFALAALIKLFPGLLLFYLASQRRWRAATAFTITAGIGAVMTALVVGLDTIGYYVTVVIPHHHYVFAEYPLNISIEGLVRTIFEPSQYSRPLVSVATEYISLFIWLVSGSVMVMVWRIGERCRSAEDGENLFVLYCITMLLLSPLTWNHTCILLLLPLSILLRDGIAHRQSGLVRVALVLLLLFWIPLRPTVDYLIGLYAPERTPWYVLVGARFGFFALALAWFVFYQRLAAAAKERGIELGSPVQSAF
jgi:alpha-1,2-mannosyltransferase